MIHFAKTTSKNYRLVQKQILKLISVHLPKFSWSESYEYEEGKLNFSLFIHQKSDVLMSHGAADKNYHWRKDANNPQHFLSHVKGRKHIFVPGPWLKNRIIRSKELAFSEDQVHVVGWPRLDHLINASRVAKKKKNKSVLWAPTHDYVRGGKLSSYPEFQQYIPKLSTKYDVNISVHPRNRKKKLPTGDLLLDSDVVVSDTGTMVYEALALGKQVIFPDWIVLEPILNFMPNCAERVIFEARHGLHASSIEEMIEMIEVNTKIDEQAEKFFDSYLPSTTHGRSGKIIAEKLLELDSSTI
ncbi:CDP-glycerol glycerophosphotransferase family protein [Tateyamaria sp.]|nr:CDP-glycerol glycerophosphotransferase family protein [Tateyamaria sp.]